MSRKWDIIDLNFVSKYSKAKELKEKIIKLLTQGIKQKDIALICNTSLSNITKIKKQYEADTK